MSAPLKLVLLRLQYSSLAARRSMPGGTAPLRSSFFEIDAVEPMPIVLIGVENLLGGHRVWIVIHGWPPLSCEKQVSPFVQLHGQRTVALSEALGTPVEAKGSGGGRVALRAVEDIALSADSVLRLCGWGDRTVAAP